ncbi:biotin--[acetyl-CoA-carboxylase] ligase [Geoalkalibacter halelectricus]|uniref:Bifunctional ligase/repressor BirA n=1 Tax=Geoalkalibacter halelectricus TaxID=2847045 RepID=A0ABY5ZRC5_9BACT|nr:biotin--[acetyl-CoA-carboxylase] ligase [Geoalkalibacter halelectricus]MDO3377014.1 biotin--[acetyl-CoA-carboxylase] ligase [Geoalkalibacter halelectricus]UWZ81236.1 biotin--[acetyl-CoA-carboxylase] ligase [Geoalkalibacter halelectricus]
MAKLPQNSQDAVLALLREQNGLCVSGAELSRRLGVSRTAIWKQIRALRQQGYRIEAAASRGYSLLGGPDLVTSGELQAGLDTRLIGRNLVYFAETDSTNSQAQRLAEEGAPDGTVVVADGQRSGKGRMGRTWASPTGVNLYTSVLLRPAVSPLRAPQLSFVAALAVARAVREHCGLAAEVKWPNDILLDHAKVAGLLSEMNAESERIHYVVLGIGLNVNMEAEQFPADLRYPATSLKLAAGHAWERAPLARHLYHVLEELYEQFLDQGFAPIARQWEALCPWRGRRIEVDRGADRVCGTFAGIDEYGALLLDIDGNAPLKIYAGDVRPLD